MTSDTLDRVMWALAFLMAAVFFGYVAYDLAGPVVRMIRRWAVYVRLLVTYLRTLRALIRLVVASWRHTRAMLLAADRRPEPHRPVARGGDRRA